MQKILVMTTRDSSIRSEAIGWTAEDGDEVVLAKAQHHDKKVHCSDFVGYVGPYRVPYCHATPLHAIGAGWKLLAPPELYREDLPYAEGGADAPGFIVTRYEWWFVRD